MHHTLCRTVSGRMCELCPCILYCLGLKQGIFDQGPALLREVGVLLSVDQGPALGSRGAVDQGPALPREVGVQLTRGQHYRGK